jgi:transposase InsO family protein
MGWKEVTFMSQRIEFITLSLGKDTNFSKLCRRFGISRKTGYKFKRRYLKEGLEGLRDRSRRPRSSPSKTDKSVEAMLLKLREKHATWGARKLKRRLEDLGHKELPSPSTITAILKRNDRITTAESEKHTAWKRFEAERPNDLWQMDFKGHFEANNGRCYPLTILDDYSRYALSLKACKNERRETVEIPLKETFCTYGLPYQMLMDNGPPWGNDSINRYTRLTVWLIRLGVRIIHSRPRHPQTLGKDERFHRTLKAEVIMGCLGKTLQNCQHLFDKWRLVYNTQRPHEALKMEVPAKRYVISNRAFNENLPPIEYGPDDHVRKVFDKGEISFRGNIFRVSKAFIGQPVAIRPMNRDGRFEVFFCHQKIAQINLK